MGRGYLRKIQTIEEKHSYTDSYSKKNGPDDLDEDNEDEFELPEDDYGKEEEDELDEDALTAESYRTTIDENPEDLDITVDDLDDEDY